ncbi:MAG: hypothetical protein RMI78_02460 [Nitrososphaerota archaeon]|nr:hypothetical protein [Nitrososphaerota archaeon]
MSSFRDFSKIGVLMIGIALLIIAGIAVHFYTYYIQRAPSPPPPTPLYAYCRNNAVIVHANQEIVSVKVLDNRSNQICFFEKIPSGSEELCMVGDYGVYVVQWGEHKDVVECFEEEIVRID